MQEAILQIFHDLGTSTKLSLRGVEDDFGIETIFELGGVACVEGSGAMMHGGFHLVVQGASIGRRRSGRSDAPPEINGNAHLIEEVHAEDAVDFAGTRFTDWTEVNRGKF